MSIETAEELAALRAAGRVVSETIRAMRRAVAPGVTTAELDAVAAELFANAGARSGPRLDYGFPGTTCISVNDEAVHGIPGRRMLRNGDLVKLDVTAELDGFYADACVTETVGTADVLDLELIDAARQALVDGMRAAIAGAPISDVGAAVERTARARGFSVCRELAGHGIGRRVHEQPTIPSYFVPQLSQRLTEGLVMTIEPILSAGSGAVRETRDGWTVRTADRARSAHSEHTIVITDGAPIVLTA